MCAGISDTDAKTDKLMTYTAHKGLQKIYHPPFNVLDPHVFQLEEEMFKKKRLKSLILISARRHKRGFNHQLLRPSKETLVLSDFAA